MKVNFPDLKGKEKETLYIVGNGFDLHHGICSTYKHFYCWLNLKGYEDFINALQETFPKLENKGDFLWRNFEDALKEYDIDAIFNQEKKKLSDPNKTDEWTNISSKIATVCNDIRPLMKQWVKCINTKEAKQCLELSNESLYLTFNYTTVLEDLYLIPKEQVCHIHGSIADDSDIIVGHDLSALTNNIKASSDEEEQVKACMIKSMNSLDKCVSEQIEKHRSFFNRLKKISRVVVLGHSLSLIDIPYFGRILKYVQDDTHWHFSKHSIEDDKRIDYFIQKANRTYKNRINNRWIFNF